MFFDLLRLAYNYSVDSLFGTRPTSKPATKPTVVTASNQVSTVAVDSPVEIPPEALTLQFTYKAKGHKKPKGLLRQQNAEYLESANNESLVDTSYQSFRRLKLTEYLAYTSSYIKDELLLEKFGLTTVSVPKLVDSDISKYDAQCEKLALCWSALIRKQNDPSNRFAGNLKQELYEIGSDSHAPFSKWLSGSRFRFDKFKMLDDLAPMVLSLDLLNSAKLWESENAGKSLVSEIVQTMINKTKSLKIETRSHSKVELKFENILTVIWQTIQKEETKRADLELNFLTVILNCFNGMTRSKGKEQSRHLNLHCPKGCFTNLMSVLTEHKLVSLLSLNSLNVSNFVQNELRQQFFTYDKSKQQDIADKFNDETELTDNFANEVLAQQAPLCEKYISENGLRNGVYENMTRKLFRDVFSYPEGLVEPFIQEWTKKQSSVTDKVRCS